MTMEINLAELARELAARMAPDALLDAEDVAALLKCSPRYVLERYAPTPGFPPAIRLPTTEGRSHPRWQRRDIVAWVEGHRSGAAKPGRRRNQPM